MLLAFATAVTAAARDAAGRPLRCVIDEDMIYFVPETSTVNLRGGKTARPEYEENWVEISEKKGE